MLFEISDKENIKSIIVNTFSNDRDLFKSYHFINNDKKQAIADTCNKIFDALDNYNGKFYEIIVNNVSIGYISVIKSSYVLYSFGLNSRYRNKTNKALLLSFANQLLGDKYSVFLYKKNIRAVKFLVKNGFEITQEIISDDSENNEKITVLESSSTI